MSRPVLVLALLAVAGIASTSAQIGSTVPTSTTTPVSPSVVAMYVGLPVEPGMERLQFLVLWRGEPGWFGRPVRSSGGGGPDRYSIRSQFSGVELEAAVDFRTEKIAVLGQAFDLRTSNVILVDGAGRQPAVVGTLGLQAQFVTPPGLPSLDRLAPVFDQPEIKAFLRCDQRSSVSLAVSGMICGTAR